MRYWSWYVIGGVPKCPRRGQLEDDAWSCVLPQRNSRHRVQGYIVEFDSQTLKSGSNLEAKGPTRRGIEALDGWPSKDT